MNTKIVRNTLLSLGVFAALAIGAQAQNLYVSVNGAVCGKQCSDFTGSIAEYTPDGTQTTLASELARPRGVAFDISGNLLAAVNRFGPPSQFQGRILKFPPLGHQSVLGNVALSFLEGMATDSAGNTFVMAQSESSNTENAIYKFAPNGTRSVFAGPSAFGDGAPIGLAVDTAGNLFVSTEGGDPGTDTILMFTPGGVESTFATGLTTPRGLAFDASGNLFVAESNAAPDGDILEFAAQGGAPALFASGIDSPEFLAFGPPR